MSKLTALEVKSIQAPGRYTDGNGLTLVVKPSGARTWQLRIQHGGRRRDIGLGSARDVSPAEAREKALETRKLVRQGKDPVALRKDSQRLLEAIPTFEAAARQLHTERVGGWRNDKHRAQWLSSIETYAFPKIGNMLVSDISVADVRNLLLPIWQTKPETARRVLQRIGSVLDWAFAEGHRQNEAPLRSIRQGLGRQNKQVNHHAALAHDQVAPLMHKLATADTSGRLALRFLILTAARSGEVRGACWSEIDLKAATWTIPAARMKAKREHIVALSQAALDVLTVAHSLRRTTRDALVFPGLASKGLSDMTLTKVLRTAIGGRWTVHGFRSSFRDWVAEQTDYRSEVAEAALAHTIPNKVEAAYRRTNYLELRIMLMADWAVYLKLPGQRPI